MIDRESPGAWFPEPSTDDPTYARRGESPALWLARSTTPRARAARRILNQSIAALPAAGRPILVRHLHTQWTSALFELIVARTLQALGAILTLEPASLASTHVDFRAQFPDGTVGVEATVPVFNAGASEEMKAQGPLLEIIERQAPAGVGIDVVELPGIGPGDSKREFKEAVARLLADPQPATGDAMPELQVALSSGLLRLRLLPRRYGDRAVAVEPGVAAWDDSEERIRHAVKQKRRQARNEAVPMLIAIHGAGIATSIDDFDHALFGRSVMRLDERRQVIGQGFAANGAFAGGPAAKPPTYAGALAFLHVGLLGGPSPVLYRHPRYTDALPRALTTLEQRWLDRDGGQIVVQPAAEGVPERLDLVWFSGDAEE